MDVCLFRVAADMAERGIIENPARKRQILRFNNLTYGTITPTDLDGVIEYKNRAYVFFEIKYRGAQVKYGQKLALERLVKDSAANDKKSVAIIADHYVDDCATDVDAADCKVREIFLFESPQWRATLIELRLGDFIELFLAHYLCE